MRRSGRDRSRPGCSVASRTARPLRDLEPGDCVPQQHRERQAERKQLGGHVESHVHDPCGRGLLEGRRAAAPHSSVHQGLAVPPSRRDLASRRQRQFAVVQVAIEQVLAVPVPDGRLGVHARSCGGGRTKSGTGVHVEQDEVARRVGRSSRDTTPTHTVTSARRLAPRSASRSPRPSSQKLNPVETTSAIDSKRDRGTACRGRPHRRRPAATLRRRLGAHHGPGRDRRVAKRVGAPGAPSAGLLTLVRSTCSTLSCRTPSVRQVQLPVFLELGAGLDRARSGPCASSRRRSARRGSLERLLTEVLA